MFHTVSFLLFYIFFVFLCFSSIFVESIEKLIQHNFRFNSRKWYKNRERAGWEEYIDCILLDNILLDLDD